MSVTKRHLIVFFATVVGALGSGAADHNHLNKHQYKGFLGEIKEHAVMEFAGAVLLGVAAVISNGPKES